MKFWALVPVDVAGGDKLSDLLAPYRGETNKLDGWRPSLLWVKGAPTEMAQRAEWDAQARSEYRDWVEGRGLAATLRGLGATDTQVAEAYDIRSGETEDAFAGRRQLVPYAFLHQGDWLEQEPAENDGRWRDRFAAAYAHVPDGTLCVWVHCHR